MDFASQSGFMDPLYAEVFEDLMKLSRLTSLPPAAVAKQTVEDDDLAERLAFVSKYMLCQRRATDEEVSEYLALLGIPVNAVPAEKLQVIATILHFCKEAGILLSLGGDDRLTVVPAQHNLNKYLSSTFPRADILRRGSCTCSTIVSEGYDLANRVLGDFWDPLIAMINMGVVQDFEGAFFRRLDSCNQSLIKRLKTVLGIDKAEGAEVVLFPSGSDAEFLPLVLALLRSHSLAGSMGPMVYNYVTAAGEVGSGTANAATGQHFSALTPVGAAGSVGQYIQPPGSSMDLATSVKTIQFAPRAPAGHVNRSATDEQLIAHVRQHLSATGHAVACIHVVQGSKTGLCVPDITLVRALQKEFPERVFAVVDACQLRVDLDAFAGHMANGDICLVTASKFFTGPPFSGAVLVPAALVAQLEKYAGTHPALLPQGLREYLTPFDASTGLPQFRAFLSSAPRWGNLGLYVRWSLGLRVMEAYKALDRGLVEEFTRLYIARLRHAVRSHYTPFLHLHEDAQETYGLNLGACNTIVSFVLRVGAGGDGAALRDLSAAEAKDFHRLLTLHYVDDSAGDEHVQLFNACKALLGQPVKVTDSGVHVLRIALGADMVVAALRSDPVEAFALADHVRALRFAFTSCTPGFETNASTTDEDLLDAYALPAKLRDLYRAQVHGLLAEDDAVLKKVFVLARNWSAWDRKRFQHTDVLSLSRGAARPAKALATPSLPAASLDGSGTFSANMQEVLVALRERRLLHNTTVVYDLNALDAAVRDLSVSFAGLQGCEVQHCLAIKSCPLMDVLRYVHGKGVGFECASINEVKHALAAGAPPQRIIFDSPCKSDGDLLFALTRGVTINCNSYGELYALSALLARLPLTSSSRIGLRVNPLVGGGSIQELSTATLTSKFGVPLFTHATVEHFAALAKAAGDGSGLGVARQVAAEVMLRDEEVCRVLAAYSAFPFLSGVMCHVGSQGMPVHAMALGAQRCFYLADLVDFVCAGHLEVVGLQGQVAAHLAAAGAAGAAGATGAKAAGSGQRRVAFVDIGGGLSANYLGDSVEPRFSSYAACLRDHCGGLGAEDLPALDTAAAGLPPKARVLYTEFGKAIMTKAGCVLAKVEDAYEHRLEGGRRVRTVVVHAGADLLLRTAYVRDKFPQRISAHASGSFAPLVCEHSSELYVSRWEGAESREATTTNIVGPLCFSGDVLAEGWTAPALVKGDFVCVHDAGANSLSLFSKHCSRASPSVVFVRCAVVTYQGQEERVLLTDKVRDEESSDQVLGFWS